MSGELEVNLADIVFFCVYGSVFPLKIGKNSNMTSEKHHSFRSLSLCLIFEQNKASIKTRVVDKRNFFGTILKNHGLIPDYYARTDRWRY